jgi:thioredoxin 1
MQLLRSLLAAALIFTAFTSQALEIKPYSDTALAQAQQAGQAVAVHFHAEWCPTCKQQEKALQALKAEPGLDVTVLVADYDKEKELKKRLNIRSQSVFVVYRGAQERGRINGETKAEAIRSGLKAALQ